MLHEQEKIDKYLNGEMEISECRAFEIEIANNPKLAESIALHKDLEVFFKERNPSLEQALSDLGNNYFVDTENPSEPAQAVTDSSPQSNYSWFTPILLLLIISVGSFWYLNKPSDVNNNISPAKSVNTSTMSPIDAEKIINDGMIEEGGIDENTTIEELPVQEIEVEEVKEEGNPNFNPAEHTQKSGNQPIAKIDKKVFSQNAVLESLIQENVRSKKNTEATINQPTLNKVFRLKNKKINLVIQGTISDDSPVELIIYDNRSLSFNKDYPLLKTVLIAKKDTDNYTISFNANIDLSEGLYYYIIRKKATADILHTSKFQVKQ